MQFRLDNYWYYTIEGLFFKEQENENVITQINKAEYYSAKERWFNSASKGGR